MPEAITTGFPSQGMIHSVDPLAVPDSAYRLGINVSMGKQVVGQRHGVQEIALRSDTEGLVEEFQALSLQGAIPYSPSQGQSAIQFSSKGDFVAIAAGGRKFLIEVVGRGGSSYGTLVEITGGFPQAPDLHLCWMGQAENYLIAGDDYGQTWTFDGAETAELSPGYNPSTPEESRVPNRSRLPVYSHGRLITVLGARSLLVGDIIHGGGKTDASALLKFIEQVYWATGAEFTLPSDARAILAVYNLPTLGRASDHGELVIEAEDRVYTLRTQLHPRTSWIDTPNMLVTVSRGGGARGPWAFDVYADDSIRRTTRGIETLSFSQQSSDLAYSPQAILSDAVDDYLELDYGPSLRFNSTKIHRGADRLYTTIRPWLSGPDWKHRGLLSFNFKLKVWEGANVYPEALKDVKCLVPLGMSGETRMLMVAGNDETSKKLRLVEIMPTLREDVLVEGPEQIPSSVYTRSMYGDLDKEVSVEEGTMQFANVLGDVEWRVLWKSDWSQGSWTVWNEGKFCHDPCSAPTVKHVDIGVFNGKEVNGVTVTVGRSFEFVIQWKGRADLRFHKIDLSRHEPGSCHIGEEVVCTEDPIICDENSDPLIPWR